VLVLLGCFTARAVMQRSSAGAKLASLRAQAAATLSEPRCTGANAAPLWLRAAEISEGAKKVSGGVRKPSRRQVERSLALTRRAASLSECCFISEHSQASDRPGASLIAAASMTTLCGGDMLPGGRGIDPGMALVFTPVQQVRALAQLLGSEAIRSAREGNMGAAAERLREGFVLSRHLCQTRDAAAIVAAAGVDQELAGAAAEVLSAGAMPVDDARRLSAELGSLDYYAALGRVVDAECARVLSGVAQADAERTSGLWQRMTRAVDKVSGARDARVLERIETLERLREVLTQPWREASKQTEPLLSRSVGSVRAHVPTPGPFVACRVSLCRDNAIARRALVQAALALGEHRSRHGAYPQRLSDARIEGLKIPADVYSGRPLIYRAKGDRLDLGSVGGDLVEGGTQADDIIWGARSQGRT